MSVKTIRINKMEELSKILFDHPFDAAISRNRDFFLYRGLPDSTFSLVTSLQRVCKQKQKELETDILDNFAKYAELVDSSISRSIWRKMILGQHHGLPTRLLDWSKSPLIALNFAMTEGNMDDLDKRDCVVWRIDVNKLHQHLPEKYSKVCREKNQNLFTVDMISEVCDSLSQYDEDMGSTGMLILEPPSMDSRMMNQYSFFSVMPSSAARAEDVLEQYEDAAVRYVINKNIRWEIRDFLDQSNVNERIVYPGLDGIAQWVSRQFYVRNTGRLHIEKLSLPKLDADVIVNSTDATFRRDGRVSRDIIKNAGPELEAACSQISGIELGKYAVTEGYKLKADVVLHACVPKWKMDMRSKNDPMLINLYNSCLQYVVDNNYHSIGFPLLATGNNGYPVDMAWRLCLKACSRFMEEHQGYPLDISICVLNEEMYLMGVYFLNEVNGVKTSPEDLEYLKKLLMK